jgi:hypothetical protein
MASAFEEGEVVPVLGAGANLCGRSAADPWGETSDRLPSGTDLARYLLKEFNLQDWDDSAGQVLAPPEGDRSRQQTETRHLDLVRIAQYIALMNGYDPLKKKLHQVFDREYTPTPLHDFLASLPSLLEKNGSSKRYLLVVTTNYDDVLERAFTSANEPYDLVAYQVDGKHAGKFVHVSPGAAPVPINVPGKYGKHDELSLKERNVILKIHGLVRRHNMPLPDSFVITEDHYIDYLSRRNVSDLLPIHVKEKLVNSSLLFLGYSLRDWNVRVILHHIWSQRDVEGYTSWAVQRDPDEIDERFWKSPRRNVEIFDMPLDEYVRELSGYVVGNEPE